MHATADGQLVAFHDHVLDRVTDRTGPVGDLPWREVRRARIEGRGTIPLLEDVLGTWSHVRVNIDPKDDRAVGPLVRVIQRTVGIDRVCVGSFSDRRIALVRQRLGPRLCTGMGPRAVGRLVAASMGLPVGSIAGVCAQVPVSFRGVPVVTERFVAEAHRRSLAVHVRTVDDPAEMHRLLDLGVVGIMTDRPRELRAVLRDRRSWFA